MCKLCLRGGSVRDLFWDGLNIKEDVNTENEYTKPCEFIIENGLLKKVKYLVHKRELIIPEGVYTISNRILDTTETSNLEKIIFPSTLVDLGEENFVELKRLKEIVVNDNFILENGCLYTRNYKSLCLCLKDTKGELFVNDNCEMIYPSAFYWCNNLTKIILPNNLKRIGREAFYKCEKVREIVLPSQIDSIGENAFTCCHKLRKVKLPNNLTRITQAMFCGCDLKKLKIPNSIVKVEDCNDKYSTFVELSTKLILSKSNKVVEDYCNKYGIRYEFENSKKYKLEVVKDMCINEYGKEFLKLFKEWYYVADGQQKNEISCRLQSIFNKVITIKIKGQGYIFDNQIRKWFLSTEKEVPFCEDDKKLKRYYDKFCSFLLVYKSVNVITEIDRCFFKSV